jgi:DNA polymerase-3 subunit epsilon
VDFTALDVETANPDMASICQIGLAIYKDGVLSDEWKSLVNPEDEFDPMNISIHRIDKVTVKGAPKLPKLVETICGLISDRVVVCHTHFDRVAMRQAFDRYGVATPEWTWLDSARVARRAWEEFAWRGYGLRNVCKTLGYEYAAHDALEDAKAAGTVLLAAIKRTGVDLEGWLTLSEEPIGRFYERPSPLEAKIARRKGLLGPPPNVAGPLFGEVLVFTGALSLPRRMAAEMAADLGCAVEERVTGGTTLLVVGNQDIRVLAGHEKSSKHRRAEELIAAGQPIRILKESDFEKLVHLAKRPRG